PRQCLPCRTWPPADRLADQAGTGTRFLQPRRGRARPRWHPPGSTLCTTRTTSPSADRAVLGRAVVMSATLHDLHRPLGSTGLTISPLGLGTVKLGRDQGVKYPNGFSIPDDKQARELLALAREL